jgi:DNA repair protein SbcD/Mre11
MRFIHTADWHLGRLLFGASLLEDQRVVLDEFCELVGSERPDAVLISGDVYDRAFPPPEAVELLDEVLTRLVMVHGTRVVLIAGNHDSPERIGFASRVLRGAGLHVAGPVCAEPMSVVVPSADGPVRIWALPYADPPEVAEVLEDPAIRGHEAAVAAQVQRVRAARNHGEREVLVTHAFVSGGEVSESERPLSVGGAAQISGALFQDFHYVALGHLHRPQTVGGERVRYAGSLLKYSFQEAEHRKTVSLVELGDGGRLQVEQVELHPRRDVRMLRGTLSALLAAVPAHGREDYLWVDLLDETPVYNAIERLRAVYPNVLHAAREQTQMERGGCGPSAGTVHRLGLGELFGMFFRDVTGEALEPGRMEAFTELAAQFGREKRGA